MDDKFPRTGDEWVVLGRFGCITFIEHFIYNLMLPLILQEEPVHSPEVRTPVLGDASFQGNADAPSVARNSPRFNFKFVCKRNRFRLDRIIYGI